MSAPTKTPAMIAPATNPNTIIDYNQAGALMENALLSNDLGKMTSDQRVKFYGEVCRSLKLNPLTRPFQYITLNGKLTLYATKDCAEQLRKINKVSLEVVSKDVIEGTLMVTVRAIDASGRYDESTGAVDIATLKGEARANAFMKAETKAKRRATLSICGLGISDETEISSIPGARVTQVDHETGEIIDVEEQQSLPQPKQAKAKEDPYAVVKEWIKTNITRDAYDELKKQGVTLDDLEQVMNEGLASDLPEICQAAIQAADLRMNPPAVMEAGE